MRLPVGAVTCAAVLVLVAGCGTAPDDPGAAQPAPGASGPGAAQPGGATKPPLNVNVAQALQTAEKEFGLLKKGDWAAAWELWTDTAKKEVPSDVFVETNKACPKALKRDYQLQNVTPINNELIELVFRRGDKVENGALRSVPGSGGKETWAFEPGGSMLVEYASGADAAIEKRKTAKEC